MRHNPDSLRHIPEDELHAYLDQALSRSQCVEIEHHLASCPVCRAERDGIAALRDRTTALLVQASPRRIRPRPFTHLSTTFAERSSRRSRVIRGTAWAASVLGALGLGWGLHQWSISVEPAASQAATVQTPLQAPPVVATTPAPRAVLAAQPDVSEAPAARNRPLAAEAAPKASQPPEAAPEAPAPVLAALPQDPPADTVASLPGTSSAQQPVLSGVWRTVAWDNTPEAGEQWVPRVEGVPVVQVKVREAPQGGRPITLVMQQLANGEMISTVEGPAPEVAALLSQQPGQSASAELQDMQAATPVSNPDPSRAGSAPGNVPRTLAIFGSAPSDSLKALMLRVK